MSTETDAPRSASPVLRTFSTSLSDRLNNQWDPADRQRLVALLPRMVGTAGDGQDEARSHLALDWLIRTYTPAWLDLAGLTAEAQALRDLRCIVDLVSAQDAGPDVRQSREKATAAREAAWAAGGDADENPEGSSARSVAAAAVGIAARAAERAAGRDEAWAAGLAAGWGAVGEAARAAAREAVWAAAWTAGGSAARAAAGDEAWAAGLAAAWVEAEVAAEVAAETAAEAAAEAAARDALAPTVATLQASAFDLLSRMIDPAAAEVTE